MKKNKPRTKSFTSKEALIRWLNIRAREIIDMSPEGNKLKIIYREFEWQ